MGRCLRIQCLARARRAGWRLAAGSVAALATLTRPEGFFLFGLLIVDAICERRTPSSALPRRLGALLLGYVPLVLVYEACMGSYYGAYHPNSIDAKVGISQEQILRGLHYAGVFVRNHPVHGLIPLVALWRWTATGPDERLLLRATALFALLPVAVGGDWMLGYRLFHPAIAIGACLLPFVLASIPAGFVAPRRRRLAAASGLTALALLGLAGSLRDPHVTVATRPTLVYAGIRIGQWMRTQLPSDALLATNTASSIPFHSGLATLDMMGLNDKTIAQRRDLPAAWKGIEKGDGRYVLSREPDYIGYRQWARVFTATLA